jgi:hypothetical protein
MGALQYGDAIKAKGFPTILIYKYQNLKEKKYTEA